jgi:ABC-type Fe2+-enterobactin transport system substrate-binding protein
MHRNTYLLVIILAVFAALVVGVNIGRQLTGAKQSPTPPVRPSPIPTLAPLSYTNTLCGFMLAYPASLTMMGNTTASAILTNTKDTTQSVIIACQKDIPRPALNQSNIETILIHNPQGSTVSAKLYHDSSPKDGTPIDELIFRNPKTGVDIFIAGMGATFNQILKTIQLLP